MRHAWVVALLSLAACGEVPQSPIDAAPVELDAPGDPCTQSEVSIDDFFSCLSQEVCRVYEDCVGSDTAHLDCAALPINVFGDLNPVPLKVVIHDAVDSGRAQWNPTAARACLDLITVNGCGLFKNEDIFQTCAAIVGNVNNGQACQNDIECATPGAQCVPPAAGGTDVCVGFTCRAPVPSGQSCVSPAFCRPEDHCVDRRPGGVDTSFCATGEVGQGCDSDSDCDRGHYCNGGTNNSTAAGICTLAKTAGSTCRVDEECAGELVCVGNVNGANGTCRDVRPVGATCDRGGFGGCFGHQYCDATATASGTCKPAPQLNAACGTVDGTASYCGFFMACEGEVCRAPGNIGDPCTQSSLFGIGGGGANGCNQGLFCDKDLTMATVGACQAPQANGSQCRPNRSELTSGASRMCASDWCGSGVCSDFPTCNF